MELWNHPTSTPASWKSTSARKTLQRSASLRSLLPPATRTPSPPAPVASPLLPAAPSAA
ncbi:hypothetical protein EK904_000487 [Melospiza melodia maxima]|nr:hypothetical protein EK904_000487 [Melospiza melodia maxima]